MEKVVVEPGLLPAEHPLLVELDVVLVVVFSAVKSRGYLHFETLRHL